MKEWKESLTAPIYKKEWKESLTAPIYKKEWKESLTVPTYKKGDKTDCSNYRGISLLLTTYKTLSNNLLSKLTPQADEIIGVHQWDFEATGQLPIIRYMI